MTDPRPTTARPTAMTVLGPVPASDLGATLAHEHLHIHTPRMVSTDDPAMQARMEEPVTLANLGWVRQYWTWSYDNLVIDDEPMVIAELERFTAAGGGSIIDVTLPGIDRDPRSLAAISRASGVHVVMGTGAYVGFTHPAWVERSTVEELAERFTREATEGVDDTGIRAGIVGEIGCTWPLTEGERKVLEAAALTQRRTGLSISIHPGRDPAAPAEILELLGSFGADLERVIIGHIERTLQDLDGILALFDSGCSVAFDIFGLETSFYPLPDGGHIAMTSDAQRLELIEGIVAAGFADRVLVGHDVCTKHRLARYGGHGWDHLLANVRPWMRTRGWDEADIERVFVANPARLLAIAAPGAP